MSNFFKGLRYLFEYIPVWLFYHAVRLIPLRVIVMFSACCGWTLCLLPGFNRLVTANIRVAFPGASPAWVRRTAARSFGNLIRTILEFFWFSGSPRRMDKHVFITDEVRERIEFHAARGEKIIFVTPHIGNWEAVGLKLALLGGLKFAVVVRPPRNPFLNRLILNSRKAYGNEVINAKGAVRGMLKAVRNGRSMATLIDQNTRVRDGGVFVDFFGLPVPSSRAPAVFAKMPDVKIYVGGGLHTPDGRILSFMRELPKPEKDYADDTEMIQDLLRITERVIRRHPEQYLWFYKRFQYIPREAGKELQARYPFYARVAPDKFYQKKDL